MKIRIIISLVILLLNTGSFGQNTTLTVKLPAFDTTSYVKKTGSIMTGNLSMSLPSGVNTSLMGYGVGRDGGLLQIGQGSGSTTAFIPIVRGKPIGNTSMFIRAIQSATASGVEALRFSVSNTNENNTISGTVAAFTFYNWSTHLATMLGNGNFGLGQTSPTAKLHIAAGTATAGTAPLKFTSGTNLTTPENGAVEYDGTNYYATSGGTRYILTRTLTGTAAPATTPAAVGIHFVDTTNKKIYVSTGTSSSSDWTILN